MDMEDPRLTKIRSAYDRRVDLAKRYNPLLPHGRFRLAGYPSMTSAIGTQRTCQLIALTSATDPERTLRLDCLRGA